MAYGFNAQEEQAREDIRWVLVSRLSSDGYNLRSFVADPLTFGLCTRPFKRDRIVGHVREALEHEGYVVQRTATTKLGNLVYAFLEVNGIAVEIGAAKRGGLGIFVSTIKHMDESITTSNQQLLKEEQERLMKEQISAKLTDEELKFLGWHR